MRAGTSAAWRGLGTLFGAGTAAGLSDEQLLERFNARRAEAAEAVVAAEAAFAAIVLRHGPMVLAVCRRLLADARDAEDAFQATFLVLARRAGSLNDGARLGGWLRRVATRVALRARADACRRRRREAPLDAAEAEAGRRADVGRDDRREALAEELTRLPAKYRAAIELCHLEGLTVREAGERLGRPEGTVCTHLARGRGLLRSRLARRGLAPAAVLASASPGALAEVPARLLNATARAAARGAGYASTHAISLSRGVLTTMFIAKLKWAVPLVAAAGIGLSGTGGRGSSASADDPAPREQAASRWDRIESEIEDLARSAVRHRRAGEHGAALRDAAELNRRLAAWQGMIGADARRREPQPAGGPQAEELLLRAKSLMDGGKLDEASRLIDEARALPNRWAVVDDNPDGARIERDRAVADLYRVIPDGAKPVKPQSQPFPRPETPAGADVVQLKQYYDSLFAKGAAPSQESRLRAVEEKLDRLLRAMEKPATPSANQPTPKGNQPGR